MEGTAFGGVPLNVELKLEVWDSPNSAGVVIDAVRCAKLALDNGLKGALIAPSAYFKKSPPVQFPDDQARLMVEEYIQQYGHKKGQGGARAARNGARNGKLETTTHAMSDGASAMLKKPRKVAKKKKAKAGAR